MIFYRIRYPTLKNPMPEHIKDIDSTIINSFRRIEVPLARIAIFIVYFWFGLLKIFGVSSAGPLVHELFQYIMPAFIPFPLFYGIFALYEVAIGILFLIRGCERPAILLLAIHLVTTAMPLVLLPATIWHAPFVPTLEGQYIIKNVLIAAAAVVIGANLVTKKTF